MYLSALIIGLLFFLATIFMLARHWYRKFPVIVIYHIKRHLQAAFDSIDDPIAVISNEYRIIRVNKAYSGLVSSGYHDIIGRHCFEVLRRRSTVCADCLLTQALDSGKRQVTELSAHPDGTAGKSISLTFFPFHSGIYSSPSSIIEHIRDISEMERLRHDLEKQNLELKVAKNHLEAAHTTFRQEVRLARDVQRGILPTTFPSVRGLEINLTYQPIADVGGDIYDFIRFSPTRLGIFIGDASGHGLAAAFVCMLTKMALYNHTRTELPPSELLRLMNVDLIRNISAGHYVTCFWGILDTGTNTFCYSRAGHPQPVVIRSNGDMFTLSGVGTFLGIVENFPFEEKTFTLEKGDRLYLFTDGLYMNTPGENGKETMLNHQRFTEILQACNSRPFDEIVLSIKQELARFTCEDDYTLLVVEVAGGESCDGSNMPGRS